MKLTEFYQTDYVDYGSYDNLRKIGSAIDGQKNASRKILYTILEKNIKNEIKVSQLSSKMAEFAEYLHGDASGVIVTLAKNYMGTNNIPLLTREGNFGTRFNNEASASRYIYTNGSKDFFNLFSNKDSNILEEQYFENHKIEPKFYLPTLPLLLINGSEGVSSGFAQKILNRNPNKIKKYIMDYLNGKLKPTKSNSLEPYFEGFQGTIEAGEKPNQWYIKGKLEQTKSNIITITEVPIGYDLRGYLKVLDDLEDKGTIQTYKDLSENDIFKFEIKIKSVELANYTEDKLYDLLKLKKTITENFTAMDAENKIREFNSAKEVLDYYIEIKLKYLKKRKDYLITNTELNIRLDTSKYLFIKNIVEDKLIINKRKKEDIIKDILKIPNIIKKDDSFDYLLNMSISSLTEERMNKLLQDIKAAKDELDKIKVISLETMWLEDLK